MATSQPAATVRPADAVAPTSIPAGHDAAFRVLVGPQQGETGFVLRRFTFGAGGGMPYHTNLVEHQQYVLRGRARIRIADAVHEVGADDTLFIPAGVPHSYEVVEGPFEFICVVPDKPDRVTLVEP
ncbi:MAG: cupin domain-containing protein [Gemmatimonadaceae bacterium]|nr:cupin domain-containing protein [Gemmatimonadaceae bacterium]MCW5825558.1 cupin domain-containing protein [Gemmatimonadaceae bacterium]